MDVKLLADKAVVITGAGSGVGRASAELFAQHGARVVCADVRGEWVEETVRRVDAASGDAMAVSCDVARPGDVDAAIEAAPFGIRANCICPGGMFTNFAVGEGEPAFRERTAEELEMAKSMHPLG